MFVVLPKVPERLLTRVASVIDDYALVPNSELAVATSGGKDSIFACLALRDLGYTPIPVVVDMDFTPGWGQRVVESLSALGFETAKVLNARRIAQSLDQTTGGTGLLGRNLLALDAIAVDEAASGATPCTSCYNSKILAIEDHFEQSEFTHIAFAHHATDAVSSFLKSALMYIDRWDGDNLAYESGRFLGLCRLIGERLKGGDEDTLRRLEGLSQAGLATTDEPPRQALSPGSDRELIRPLLGLWEGEIASFIASAGLDTEPSGCGHSKSVTTQTARELVQYEIVRALEESPVSARLLDLAMQNLDDRGGLLHDARRDRDRILGSQYKQSFDGLEKL